MGNILVNGIDLYYEIKGDQESKEAVLFFNGLMASANSWYPILSPLDSLGLRLVLHDFRGQLLSSKPQGPYSYKLHAEDVLALCDHLGVDKFHMVSTSYGGMVAMTLAGLHPDRIKSLTLIDSSTELTGIIRNHLKLWKKMAQENRGEDYFWAMSCAVYGETFFKNNWAMLESRAKAVAKISDEFLQGQVELIETVLCENGVQVDLVRNIKCPTLVICGIEDYFTTINDSKNISQLIDGSEFVILPDCGHVSIFEKPKEISTLVSGLLTKTVYKQNQPA